jgi:hypothetical protein
MFNRQNVCFYVVRSGRKFVQRVVAALFLLEALLCALPASLFEAAPIDFKTQKVPVFAADLEQRLPSAPAVSKTEVQSECSHRFQSPLVSKAPCHFSIVTLTDHELGLDTLPPASAWNYYYIRSYICCIGEAPSTTGPPARI